MKGGRQRKCCIYMASRPDWWPSRGGSGRPFFFVNDTITFYCRYFGQTVYIFLTDRQTEEVVSRDGTYLIGDSPI